ncbi:MAG: GIY-YIG nuclease family protein [Crocinitomicaceae bacterium]|nr:GIY-YIG nuclease family protein [Crocinitomicaceae bacterium]
MKTGFVYIMSNKNRTVLYIGVNNNIERRVKEHKAGVVSNTFTSRYMLYELLYFERIEGFGKAIDREKQLKSWRREWKWDLIKMDNPDLIDQAADWFTIEELEERRLNYALSRTILQTLNQVQSDDGPCWAKVQVGSIDDCKDSESSSE